MAPPTSPDQRPADVLVVFGITGDLARVMTFRALCNSYRHKNW